MVLTEESIKAMKCKEIQKNLKAAGLNAGGKKVVLIERLLEHVNKQKTEAGAEKAPEEEPAAAEEPAAEEPAAEEESAAAEEPAAEEPAAEEPAAEEPAAEEPAAEEPAATEEPAAETTQSASSDVPAEASTNTTDTASKPTTQVHVTPVHVNPMPAQVFAQTTSAPAISAPLIPTPAAVQQTDDSPLTDRKLFCGGLSNATSEDVLRAYLSQFGPLVEVVVIKDRMTQVSRGYGFATFATKADTQKVLQRTMHSVGGKDITLKLADVPGYKSTDTSKKIFIGGVDDTHSEDTFRQLFSQFGNIVNVTLLKDQAGRSRGFGFLAFDSSQAAAAALAQGQFQVGSKQITVKSATPRQKQFGGRQFGRPAYQQRSPYGNQAYGLAAAMRAQQMQMRQRQSQYGASYSAYAAAAGGYASSYGTDTAKQTAYGQQSYSGTGASAYGAAQQQQQQQQQSYAGYGGGKTTSGSYNQTGYNRYSPY